MGFKEPDNRPAVITPPAQRTPDLSGFVHLHVHSNLSFKDSINVIEETAARAAFLDQKALALTDHGHMFGAIRHALACREYGILPIFGMEAYEAIADDLSKVEEDRKNPVYPAHLTLLVMNRKGWENICAIHTKSYREPYAQIGRTGRVYPRIDRPLLAAHSEGLICMSACLGGKCQRPYMANEDDKQVLAAMRYYREVFGDRFYVELMGNTDEQRAIIHRQRQICRKAKVPTVATNDVHYLTRRQGAKGGPHNIYTAARFGMDPLHERPEPEAGAGEDDERNTTGWYGSDGFYLKTEQEMRETGFSDDELARSVEIADRCTGANRFDPTLNLDIAIPQAPIERYVDDFGIRMFEMWERSDQRVLK